MIRHRVLLYLILKLGGEISFDKEKAEYFIYDEIVNS
jgi:hypothetical protein